jgi:hypothetical protein
MANRCDSHNLFSRQPLLHGVIDSYSKFIWDVPQCDENVYAFIASLLQCFAVMGVPSKLKTDNGPAYIGRRFKQFCKEWNKHFSCHWPPLQCTNTSYH